MTDQSKINEFLSERAGMWKGQQWEFRSEAMSGSGGCMGWDDWKVITVRGDYNKKEVKEVAHDRAYPYSDLPSGRVEVRKLKTKTPLDFFTPDGMVRLMEWLRENNYLGFIESYEKGMSHRWYATFWKDNDEIEDGEGSADTPPAALALAAYEALKPKEVEDEDTNTKR